MSGSRYENQAAAKARVSGDSGQHLDLSPSARFPNSDDYAVSRRGEFPISGKCRISAGWHGRRGAENFLQRFRARVPQFDLLVKTHCDEPMCVGADRRAADLRVVRFDRSALFTLTPFPQKAPL